MPRPQRRTCGGGVPALALIAWLTSVDPHLRSALDLAAVTSRLPRRGVHHRLSVLRRHLAFAASLIVVSIGLILRMSWWRLVL